MTAVSDRLDRIAERRTRALDGFQVWSSEWPDENALIVDDLPWLLALARGHQATLEAIAAGDDEYPAVEWEHKLARERLREAEGDT